MVSGGSHNSGEGDLTMNSHLGKIQKRLRLGLFTTTHATRVLQGEPAQSTRRKPSKGGTAPPLKSTYQPSTYQPTPLTREPKDELDVILIQPLNATGESTTPYEIEKSRASSDDLHQAVEVHPEREAGIFPVRHDPSDLGPLKLVESPSDTTSPSTESIPLPLPPILTSKMNRIDVDRQMPRRPSTSRSTPESGRTPVTSKRAKSPSRRVPLETPSLFPIHDSFLPRAKPPPPLKIPTKHQRNRSLPATKTTNSTHQNSTQTNSRSKHSEPASFFPVPDATLPPPLPQFQGLPGPSSVQTTAPKKPPTVPRRPSTSGGREPSGNNTRGMHFASTSSLTRSSSRVTATSVSSGGSQNSSQLAIQWTWTPPSSWSGPPPETSQQDEEDKVKIKPRVLSRKNSASRMRPGKNTSARVNVASPSVWKPLDRDRLAEASAEEYSVADSVAEQDVIVRMQSFDGDEWTEGDMAEVISKLRTLKSSKF